MGTVGDKLWQAVDCLAPYFDGELEKFPSAVLDKQGQENRLRLAKAYEKGGEKAMSREFEKIFPKPAKAPDPRKRSPRATGGA